MKLQNKYCIFSFLITCENCTYLTLLECNVYMLLHPSKRQVNCSLKHRSNWPVCSARLTNSERITYCLTCSLHSANSQSFFILSSTPSTGISHDGQSIYDEKKHSINTTCSKKLLFGFTALIQNNIIAYHLILTFHTYPWMKHKCEPQALLSGSLCIHYSCCGLPLLHWSCHTGSYLPCLSQFQQLSHSWQTSQIRSKNVFKSKYLF